MMGILYEKWKFGEVMHDISEDWTVKRKLYNTMASKRIFAERFY